MGNSTRRINEYTIEEGVKVDPLGINSSRYLKIYKDKKGVRVIYYLCVEKTEHAKQIRNYIKNNPDTIKLKEGVKIECNEKFKEWMYYVEIVNYIEKRICIEEKGLDLENKKEHESVVQEQVKEENKVRKMLLDKQLGDRTYRERTDAFI